MSAPILIAGGYGLVGSQIARLFRDRHPEITLMLGGRHPQNGAALAEALGRAQAVPLDMTAERPLDGLPLPAAILAAVNDPADHLLRDAVRLGVPLVDLTRWTARVRDAALRLSTAPLTAPVVFSSAWMGGVVPLVAAAAMRDLAAVESVDVAILYATEDQAGPNSVDYMDRLEIPFDVLIEGTPRSVPPLTDGRQVVFPSGHRARVYRIDTPEQATLPHFSGARTVATRLGFDDDGSTELLRMLVRSGLWNLIKGPRFASLRRAILYNPGAGAAHEVVIEVTGRDAAGHALSRRAEIMDPAGQSHLTAIGGLIQLERVLGLGSYPAPEPRVMFPESLAPLAAGLETLRELGVKVTIEALASGTPRSR